jgi:hypothetical protein
MWKEVYQVSLLISCYLLYWAVFSAWWFKGALCENAKLFDGRSSVTALRYKLNGQAYKLWMIGQCVTPVGYPQISEKEREGLRLPKCCAVAFPADEAVGMTKITDLCNNGVSDFGTHFTKVETTVLTTETTLTTEFSDVIGVVASSVLEAVKTVNLTGGVDEVVKAFDKGLINIVEAQNKTLDWVQSIDDKLELGIKALEKSLITSFTQSVKYWLVRLVLVLLVLVVLYFCTTPILELFGSCLNFVCRYACKSCCLTRCGCEWITTRLREGCHCIFARVYKGKLEKFTLKNKIERFTTDIKYDEHGPYLGYNNLRLYSTGQEMTALLTRFQETPLITTVKETLLGETYDAKLPGFVAAITIDNMVVGMCSRIKFKGQPALLTAYHVLETHSSEKLYIAKGDNKYPIDPNWDMMTYSVSTSLDYCIISVPEKVFSMLGMKEGKLVGNIPLKMAVTLHGYDQFVEKRSSGVMTRHEEGRFRVKYEASSLPSWSGTPILGRNGTICGIHTMGGQTTNYGTVLPFLAATRLESATWGEMYTEGYEDDQDKENDYYDQEDAHLSKEDRKAKANRDYDAFGEDSVVYVGRDTKKGVRYEWQSESVYTKHEFRVADPTYDSRDGQQYSRSWVDIVDEEFGRSEVQEPQEDQRGLGAKSRQALKGKPSKRSKRQVEDGEPETVYICQNCKTAQKKAKHCISCGYLLYDKNTKVMLQKKNEALQKAESDVIERGVNDYNYKTWQDAGFEYREECMKAIEQAAKVAYSVALKEAMKQKLPSHLAEHHYELFIKGMVEAEAKKQGRKQAYINENLNRFTTPNITHGVLPPEEQQLAGAMASVNLNDNLKKSGVKIAPKLVHDLLNTTGVYVQQENWTSKASTNLQPKDVPKIFPVLETVSKEEIPKVVVEEQRIVEQPTVVEQPIVKPTTSKMAQEPAVPLNSKSPPKGGVGAKSNGTTTSRTIGTQSDKPTVSLEKPRRRRNRNPGKSSQNSTQTPQPSTGPQEDQKQSGKASASNLKSE